MVYARYYLFIVFAIIFSLAQASPEPLTAAKKDSNQPAVNQLAANQLITKNCWIRLMPSTLPSAGYLSIQNTGSKPVTLNKIRVPGFGMTMMHETLWKGTASSMVMLNSLTIAAKETVLFAPGGRHFMLEKPTKTFEKGQNISVELEMSDQSKHVAHCQIRAATGE